MRKSKEIKFIEIDGELFNINQIVKICKEEDGRTLVIRGRSLEHVDESIESIKKRLESITLKE